MKLTPNVDEAGVSSRLPDAQAPEEYLLPQQPVQGVREGARTKGRQPNARLVSSSGAQEREGAIMG